MDKGALKEIIGIIDFDDLEEEDSEEESEESEKVCPHCGGSLDEEMEDTEEDMPMKMSGSKNDAKLEALIKLITQLSDSKD